MPQRASVFCNFYIRVDREALVSERALDVGSVVFKAMSTKNICRSLIKLFKVTDFLFANARAEICLHTCSVKYHFLYLLRK
jgi:hypothetical protein